jgi:hypothetical protein
MKINKLNDSERIVLARTKIRFPSLNEVMAFGGKYPFRKNPHDNLDNLEFRYTWVSQSESQPKRSNKTFYITALASIIILFGAGFYYRNHIMSMLKDSRIPEVKTMQVHYYEADINRVNNPELKRKDLTLYLDDSTP